MFGLFKKKTKVAENIVFAPVKGTAVPIAQVNDPVFSAEILGKGVGIVPEEPGKVFAPCDGKVEQAFDTGHAVSLTTAQGVELLIHVGIDTVKLKGEHFNVCCAGGDAVKQGDLLLEFDMAAIAAAGYDTTVMVVVCNTDNYQDVQCETGIKAVGDKLLQLV